MADTETAPAGDDTLTGAAADELLKASLGDDTITGGDLGSIGDGIAAGSPGDLVSRDERHDSIDQHTGTLTPEATALRAERGITRAGEQPGDPEEPVE